MRCFWRPAFHLLFFALLLTLLACPHAYAQTIGDTFTGHVVAVTAGDALDIRTPGGETIAVRLHGIECPTTPRALRETATRYTSRLVLDTDVRVEVLGIAPGSVFYGEVYSGAGSDSVNSTLVRTGLARWARTYAANRSDLRAAESVAKQTHNGLWGASDGSNITLPENVSLSSPTPPPSPSPTVSPIAIPRVVPVKQNTRPSWLIVAVAGALGFAGMLVALLTHAADAHLPRDAKRLVSQLLLSVIAAALLSLLLCIFLPVAETSVAFTLPLLLAGLLPVPSLLLLRWGSQKIERAIRLRGQPVDPRHADLGFVKLQGTAESIAGDLVCSGIGDIPGLYVRERTEQYTAETSDGKRLPTARWIEISDESTAVDFMIRTTLGDGTGIAHVLSAQEVMIPRDNGPVCWLPYHVARFYNDIPTDAWYATAYEGDMRTEVFFIPDGTTLTVWGYLYPPAFLEERERGELPITRIAHDGTESSLIITDGAEARAYTGRGAPSQPLAIGALFLGIAGIAGIIYATVSGGFAAQRSALTMLGVVLAIIFYLAIRRAAWMAHNERLEAERGDIDLLRRPARATWEQYLRGFPGKWIGPAFGD